MTIKYAVLYLLMLPAGIGLTVITLLRMRAGRIALSRWAKVLVIAGMILSQVILAAAMMPVSVCRAVQDVFIGTATHPATQIEPSAGLEIDTEE